MSCEIRLPRITRYNFSSLRSQGAASGSWQAYILVITLAPVCVCVREGNRRKRKNTHQAILVVCSIICRYAHIPFIYRILHLKWFVCVRSVFPVWPHWVQHGWWVHCLETHEAMEGKWETLHHSCLPHLQTGNTISMN